MMLDDVAAELLRAAMMVQAVEERVCCANIANAASVAYKRRVVHTSVQQVVDRATSSFSLPTVAAVAPVFTAGRLEHTARNLDVAIDGIGFFSVLRPDGSTGYTRNGRWTLSAAGAFMVGTGLEACVLTPQVTIPADTLALSIEPDGRVTGVTAGSPDTSTVFGQLNLHRFMNCEAMRADGSRWLANEASGRALTGAAGSHGLGVLKQGFLERSNVDLNQELVALQILEKKRSALLATMQQHGLELP